MKSQGRTPSAAGVELAWRCPTCERQVETHFCATCGESPLRRKDLTLHGFLDQIVTACTNLDGPMLRSFRVLLTRPGRLTKAYLSGQRKPYTLPLQLFLVANLLFFAMQSWVGAKVFSTPLEMHLHNQFWSGIAQPLVEHRLAAKHITLEQYSPIFDQAVALNAKSLIIVMVLPLGLLLPLIFYGRGVPFVGHLVFSLHLYTFLLLLFSAALAAVQFSLLLGGSGLASENFDHALSATEVVISMIYLLIAIGVVYSETRWLRVVKTLLLVGAAVGVFLGYRFTLFLVTLVTA